MKDRKESDAIYVVPDSIRERKRLQEQADILNPFTVRLFENAGIKEGMRVLDVGSGAGDVAFAAAEMVGPSGSVVGVDNNPAVLETARQRAESNRYSNVSFLVGDIRSVELDAEFDAVVGRLVLMYLKDPVDAVQHTAKYLCSGGIIAFLELDGSNGLMSIPHSPTLEKMKYWLIETFKRAGVELQMGLKLRETFVAAGLPAPNMQFDAIIGGGSQWSGYKYVEDTIRSMLPVMEKLGVATAEEVKVDTLAERFRNEIVNANGVAMLSTWVGAWSQKD